MPFFCVISLDLSIIALIQIVSCKLPLQERFIIVYILRKKSNKVSIIIIITTLSRRVKTLSVHVLGFSGKYYFNHIE